MWNKIDYFDNFKLFDDVYGILDTSYMLYIPFGMTPYARIKSPKGNFIYYEMGWKKYGISTCKYGLFFLNREENVSELQHLHQSLTKPRR